MFEQQSCAEVILQAVIKTSVRTIGWEQTGSSGISWACQSRPPHPGGGRERTGRFQLILACDILFFCHVAPAIRKIIDPAAQNDSQPLSALPSFTEVVF